MTLGWAEAGFVGANFDSVSPTCHESEIAISSSANAVFVDSKACISQFISTAIVLTDVLFFIRTPIRVRIMAGLPKSYPANGHTARESIW